MNKRQVKSRKQRKDYEKKRNVNKQIPSVLIEIKKDIKDSDGNVIKSKIIFKRIKKNLKGLIMDYPASKKYIVSKKKV